MKKILILFCCVCSIATSSIAQTGSANAAPNNDKAKLERTQRPKMTDAERADIKAAKDKIRGIKAKYRNDNPNRKNKRWKKDKRGRHHKMKHRKHRKHRGEGRRGDDRRGERPHRGERGAPRDNRH